MKTSSAVLETVGEDLHAGVAELIRHAAATAIMPRFGQLLNSDVDEKSPGEVVTVADREAEAILSAGLVELLPGSRVIAEEACCLDPELLEGIDQGLLWIVDPVDGTANFAAGREPFGVIVALADNGVTRAAWLYNPVKDRMCTAVLGKGAFVSGANGPTRRVRAQGAGDRPIAMLATQFMHKTVEQSLIAAAAEPFDLRPIPRCAAEHYPMLAQGENHIALFQRTLPWDHAAGALFLSEAGGVVSRWDGSPYRFHEDRVGILAASTSELWKLARATLVGDGQELTSACQTLSPPRPPHTPGAQPL